MHPELLEGLHQAVPDAMRGTNARSAAVALLQSQGLPVSDLTEQHWQHFFYLGAEISPTGLVGLELHGTHALLRSLVVDPGARRHGLGAKLVEHAERYAISQGVGSIYLLTTTAETFFEHLGYERIDRSRSPPAIQGTREFMSLCPASAAIMMKRFVRSPGHPSHS